jgi:hypothetical protein
MKQCFQQLEDGLALAIEVSKTIKDALLEVTTLLG